MKELKRAFPSEDGGRLHDFVPRLNVESGPSILRKVFLVKPEPLKEQFPYKGEGYRSGFLQSVKPAAPDFGNSDFTIDVVGEKIILTPIEQGGSWRIERSLETMLGFPNGGTIELDTPDLGGVYTITHTVPGGSSTIKERTFPPKVLPPVVLTVLRNTNGAFSISSSILGTNSRLYVYNTVLGNPSINWLPNQTWSYTPPVGFVGVIEFRYIPDLGNLNRFGSVFYTIYDPDFSMVADRNQLRFTITPVEAGGSYVVKDPLGVDSTYAGGIRNVPLTRLGTYQVKHTLSTGETKTKDLVNTDVEFDFYKERVLQGGTFFERLVGSPWFVDGSWSMVCNTPSVVLPSSAVQSGVIYYTWFQGTPVPPGVYTLTHSFSTFSVSRSVTINAQTDFSLKFGVGAVGTSTNIQETSVVATTVDPSGQWEVTKDGNQISNQYTNGVVFSTPLVGALYTELDIGTYSVKRCVPFGVTEVCTTKTIQKTERTKIQNGQHAWGDIPDNFAFQGTPRVATSPNGYGTIISGNATVTVYVYKLSLDTAPIVRITKSNSAGGSYTATVAGGVVGSGVVPSVITTFSILLSALPLGWSPVTINFSDVTSGINISSFAATWKETTALVVLTARDALISGAPTFGTGGDINAITQMNGDTEFEFAAGNLLSGVVLDFGGRFDVFDVATATWVRVNGHTFTDLNTTQYKIRPTQYSIQPDGKRRVLLRRATGIAGKIRSFRYILD